MFDFLMTPEMLEDTVSGYASRWNFSHACGTLDGKHMTIKYMKKSGTVYYNYKGFDLIVLLGLVNADYKLIWPHVGANGSASDVDLRVSHFFNLTTAGLRIIIVYMWGFQQY